MADTITILDGLQFNKPDTADCYTMDGEGLEAVKTYAIAIPPSVSRARVIFNGNYDPDGGRYHVRVKATMLTGLGTLAKTQNTQPLEWSTVTPPAILESGDIDVSVAYSATLHIDVARSSVTANTTGIEVIVQVSKEATIDEWTDVTRFIGPTGAAATKSDFVGTNNANATTIGITNPATGNLDHVGKFIFFEDTATIAQCEIAFLVSQSGN